MSKTGISPDGRMLIHFGEFADGVKRIGETANAFVVHLDNSADAARMEKMSAAVLSASKTLYTAEKNAAQTSLCRRLLKTTHEHFNEAIRLTEQVELEEIAHAMSGILYHFRGIAAFTLHLLEDNWTGALRSATADFTKSIELEPAADKYVHLAKAYVEVVNVDAAMECLDEALRLNANFAPARRLKGSINRAKAKAKRRIKQEK